MATLTAYARNEQVRVRFPEATPPLTSGFATNGAAEQARITTPGSPATLPFVWIRSACGARILDWGLDLQFYGRAGWVML